MELKYKPQAHRPVVELREDQIPKIVEGFEFTFVLNRAAGWASVSRYHLKKWLHMGANDLDEGKHDTIYAQLFTQVGISLSNKAKEFLSKLQKCPRNAGALQWLLEKCFKNDYGTDSDEMKEMIDLYEKLLESYKRLADNRVQGALDHGREMDSKGN
jgi:hypothetical protein